MVKRVPTASSGSLTIPGSIQSGDKTYTITSVGESSFKECTILTEIILPKDITVLGKLAFQRCSFLKKITLPENLKETKDGCFDACFSLKEISFPEGFQTLGASTFQFCSNLEKVFLPTTLKKIDSYAFNRCEALTTIECRAKKAPTLGDHLVWPSETYNANLKVYVPKNATGYEKWLKKSKVTQQPTGGVASYKELDTHTLSIQDIGLSTFHWNKRYHLPKGIKGGIITVSDSKANINYAFNAQNPVINPETPLLLKGTPGNYTIVETKQEANTTDVSGNLLRGTVGLTQSTDGSTRYYVLTKKNGALGFYYQNGTDGTSVNNAPNRCFLEVNTSSPVQGFSLDDNLTGISEIGNDIEADPTAPVYDLSGRRTTSKQRGIYIVNGKRIIR